MPEQPNDPKTCEHEDTDRVGATEIVCYDCMHICTVQGALSGKPDWKPLSDLR